MKLVDRVKDILLNPKAEWPKIEPEAETTQSLYTGYILILAAIGPVAMLIRSPFLGGVIAIVSFVIALGITYVVALIVDALATTFGGEKNFMQSLKLVAYSYTAVWVAGIFHVLGRLGGLVGLLAAIYSLYTFYLGVQVMKKCPADKAVAYTLVVMACVILLGVLVFGVIFSTFMGAMFM